MNGICDDCSCLFEVGAHHECDPGEVEITRVMKLSTERHAAETDVIAAAKALDVIYGNSLWKSKGSAGLWMQRALARLAKCDLRRAMP